MIPVEEDQPIPSGQIPTNTVESSDEEFDQVGLLTQLIGPSKLSHSKTRKNKHKDKTCQQELERLHAKYLADTEVIDRATGHLDLLEKATSRGRMPTKMAINIKPLVLNRDNEQFKSEWQAAIAESEKKLMKTVTDHLKRVIDQTNLGIRKATDETFKKLKAVTDKDHARQQVEQLLKQADDKRMEKTQQRLKKKRELNEKTTERPSKKAKTDN